MSQTITTVRRVVDPKIHPDLKDLFEKVLDRLEELLEFSEGMFQGYVLREGDLLFLTPEAIKMIEEAGL